MHDGAAVRTESKPDASSEWLAPLLGIVAPSRAVCRLCGARVGTLAALAVIQAAAAACVVASLCLWGATRDVVPGPLRTVNSAAASQPTNVVDLLFDRPEIRRRTVGQVWADWHANGPLGAAEAIALAAAVGFAALLALATAFYLPWVHRAGSIATSLRRTFAGVVACGGFAIVLVVILGSVIVLTVHATIGYGFLAELYLRWLVPLVAVATVLLIGRVGRAMRAAGRSEPGPTLPPRCEGCGYDLTHQPADGRCPECARPCDDSLSPSRRSGSDWEATGAGFGAWLATAKRVVFSPDSFYRRLRLRTPFDAALRFATWTYATLGVGAAIWITCMTALVEGLPLRDAQFFASVALTIVPLVCWFGHRLGGAAVCATWIVWRSLPDTEWAARIIAYESVFLWVFCACWGLLVSSFMIWGPWLANSVARQFFNSVFGANGEEVAIFGVTALCAALWLRRYVIAMRAVRWSNF